MIAVVFAMLCIGILTSNAERRAAARQWLKPFEHKLSFGASISQKL